MELPAFLKAMARYPSSLISRIQPSSSGKELERSRSIGSTNVAFAFLVATHGV